MTNEELLAKISDVETIATETFNVMQTIMQRVSGMNNRLNSQQNEIERINNIVSAAITTAVHELIEYLHSNDIQGLDEEEFSARIQELIFNADPSVYLPF